MDAIAIAREAGRRWAADNPLNDSQRQTLWALLAEPLAEAS